MIIWNNVMQKAVEGLFAATAAAIGRDLYKSIDPSGMRPSGKDQDQDQDQDNNEEKDK